MRDIQCYLWLNHLKAVDTMILYLPTISVLRGGVLRLGLWVRGLRNPIVLVYQLFCHLQTFFFFKVGVREIMIIYFHFPEAATSTNMWSRWDHRKSI